MSELKKVVSVCMITYNHENYIKQAIEGVLMQQTSFPIELIIGEDCSTDNTRKICIEYQAKYPDIVRLILPEKNLGIKRNFIETMQAAKGNYIALCEGDDYWTDPLKLQKQVDFLEINPDYRLSFHKVDVISEGVQQTDLYQHLEEREYFATEIFEKWTVPTCSILFRNNFKLKWNKNILFGDIFLFLSILEHGKAYCHNFLGAAYRRNIGGISVNPDIKIKQKLFYQYKYMSKRFPDLKSISTRKMNEYLDQLIYAPFFKGIWKFRFYKMIQEPRLFFSGFFTTTLTSYVFDRKKN